MHRAFVHALAAVCLAIAAAAAFGQKSGTIVVDGGDWLSASAVERRAFLVGAANMVVAEAAYAKRRGQTPPPAGLQLTQAVDKLTLAQIEARVTAWYEANPSRRATPVMGVVWHEFVKRKGS